MSTDHEKDEVIVIHPPLSGESEAIADVIADNSVQPPLPSAPKQLTPSDAIRRAQSTQSTTPPPRTYGLDAYRGLFLLLMTYSMTVPMRAGVLPEWMYHMQYPVPGAFVDRAGLTWPDLIFPAFLFTMCAAIPIANSLRLNAGLPYPAILWTAVKRFVVLYIFALVIGHSLPVWTQDYSKRGNLIAIAGFLACWPLFIHKHPTWSATTYSRIKLVGWLAGAAVLFALPLTWGSTFSVDRKDGIIHALAFVSLITTTIWLFTRTNARARLLILGAVVALKIATEMEWPGGGLQYAVEAPIIFKGWMVELLIIAIPATFAGDLLIRWMQSAEPAGSDENPGWSKLRFAAIATVCLGLPIAAVIGFYLRYTTATAFAFTGISGLGLLLTMGASSTRERILRSLLLWSAILLIAGALLDPAGPGIRKDPQNLSYLVVTAGSSLALLIVLLIWADVLNLVPRFTRVLVEVGQNALIAYVAFTMFFNNIGWLTGFGNWQYQSTMGAIVGGIIFTAAVAALTAAATRNRVFWKI